jgi:DNA-binding phage protein
MNIESRFNSTASFRDYLLKDLTEPEFAKHYLEISLEYYEKDGDIGMLAHAVRNVVEARGGLGELTIQTGDNLHDLYKALDPQNSPQLDFLLEILSKLGFRSRLCLVHPTLNEQIDLYTNDMLSVEIPVEPNELMA